MFQRVAVFGLGLLGGALCRGLKGNDPGVRIDAYGRDRVRLEPALREGFVDSVEVIDRASLKGVDLVVVATPVISSIRLIETILGSPDIEESALVIDVGSVKEPVVRAAARLPRSLQFVGCHPMAGSEKTGFAHSTGTLYENSTVIITPHPANRGGDIDAVAELWTGLGAQVLITSPELHDLVVSYTSHLPHVIAGAVIAALSGFTAGGYPLERVHSFIGNGFRDVTRIAAGSPEMWRDIVLMNGDNIRNAISSIINHLGRFLEIMKDGSALQEYFAKIKDFRDGIQ
ncbi:MAG: prephenate dehydrogenase/arogenate dehydrogenase family protein [Spirochaetes bacterium]|nr:prephenate dehydrogenase/arogenate dehydrogenase family protein [Spirochaetota bacterium]